MVGEDEASIGTARAERNLASLDRDVRRALLEIGRRKSKAALIAPEGSRMLTRALLSLEFEVEDIDPGAGGLPEGTVLFVWVDDGSRVLGPALVGAVRAHLEGGGSALLVLEPENGDKLAPWADVLGLALDPTPAADDSNYARLNSSPEDHRNLVTDELGVHPSTASALRAPSRAKAAFLGAGSLKVIGGRGGSTVITVRSSPSAFRDLDRDLERGKKEKRERLPIGAAVAAPAGDAETKAVVFSDATWLGDKALDEGDHITLELFRLGSRPPRFLAKSPRFPGAAEIAKRAGERLVAVLDQIAR